MTTNANKLAAAAEELIKAASSHVESATLSCGKDIVAGLAALKESMDAKLNSVTQHLVDFKAQMAVQEKNRSIEWAYSNASANSFKYYIKQDGPYNFSRQEESSVLVKTILLAFKSGTGLYINNRSLTDYQRTYGANSATSDQEKEFRDELVKQIHQLLGKKPRVALAADEYAIYYE